MLCYDDDEYLYSAFQQKVIQEPTCPEDKSINGSQARNDAEEAPATAAGKDIILK